MLRGIRPDYWICASGAQVLDKNGSELASKRMTEEEMYALTDFCENYELPLAFSFTDGSYAYLEYERTRRRYQEAAGGDEGLHDGEDQDRHLLDMPFAASGEIPREMTEKFQQKYGYLGLRFLYYCSNACDILRAGQDKAEGLAMLWQKTGISAAQTVAVGDGDNDSALLRAAGLGVCMQNGSAEARKTADRVCPPVTEDGVAVLCRELWPQVFAEKKEVCLLG
jgi:HAD superfamily hydrolase (TIGR01484 family)